MQRLKTLIKEPFYRNSASIIANSLTGTFFGLAFWVVAAHLVQPDVMGLAIATISAATFLTSLSRLGMDDVLVRFLPGSGDRSRLYGSILAVTLLLSLLFAAAFLVLIGYLAPALGYLQGGWYPLLFLLYMATVSVYTTQNTTLLAIRRADLSFVQNVLLGLRIPALLLLAAAGAAGIFISFNLSYLVALSLGLLYLLKLGLRPGALSLKSVVKTVRGHFGYSAGNYLSAIFAIMPSTLLPIVIMNTTGAEEVAYFYIAYSIAALLFIIPNAVSMSLFIEGSHDMPLDEYTYRSIKLILAIVIPLVILLYFFGDWLLLLFNREYSEQSIGLLKLLVVSSLFSAVTSVYASVRRVEKDVRSLNVASAVTSALIVGLGYAFLSAYGLTGLGYAWIVSYALMSAVLLGILIKEGKVFGRSRK